MISNLELRHIIESSFLPLECVCTVNAEGSLTIQLLNPLTRQVDLTTSGIPVASLSTIRAISDLVAQLREEYLSLRLAQQDSQTHWSRQG
jgi:hypothetical protein